jgi:hypothetical protein
MLLSIAVPLPIYRTLYCSISLTCIGQQSLCHHEVTYYMVRWYIFDIGSILISVRINEFLWLRDVGSTYLTVVA